MARSRFFRLHKPSALVLRSGDAVVEGRLVGLAQDGLLVESDGLEEGKLVHVESRVEGADLAGALRVVKRTEPEGPFILEPVDDAGALRERLDALATEIRKSDHLRICLEEDVSHRVGAGFERYRLIHCALPECAKDRIDTSTFFLGKRLRLPLLISCMTGGSLRATAVNRTLAQAAQRGGVGIGLGSQRALLGNPEALPSFAVRALCPDVPLLGNIGAVQLNYGVGLDDLRELVLWVSADALVFHLNPLQEAIQPEGDTDFEGIGARLAEVVPALGVPAILKEIGAGISGRVAKKAESMGFHAVDVAGAGGTSWALVESERASDPGTRDIGRLFADWGIPTADALVSCRLSCPSLPLIASGGIRNGLEAAKAIALGADLVAIARPFLHAAEGGVEAVLDAIARFEEELRVAMFCAGARDLRALREAEIVRA